MSRLSLKIEAFLDYIRHMKNIALTTVLVLSASLVSASEETEADEGTSMMQRGAEMLLEGLMQEMSPAIEDLRGMAEKIKPGLREFVDEMGPAFADLLGKIDNFSAYHPPEILPNGDIIIRRKTPMEELLEDKDEIEI